MGHTIMYSNIGSQKLTGSFSFRIVPTNALPLVNVADIAPNSRVIRIAADASAEDVNRLFLLIQNLKHSSLPA